MGLGDSVSPGGRLVPGAEEARPARYKGLQEMKIASAGIPMSNLLSALSFALDLTEGQPMGHALRSCFIGMKIGERLGLSAQERAHLFYALLLKDAGCSSTAAHLYSLFGTSDVEINRSLKAMDWTRLPRMARFIGSQVASSGSLLSRVRRYGRFLVGGMKEPKRLWDTRCDRGAAIAARMGFPPEVSTAVAHLDEHWDGKGYPGGLRGEEIPLFSRILCLAQTLEVFLTGGGVKRAVRVVRDRAKRWFDPELAEVARSLCAEGELDLLAASEDVREEVMAFEPEAHRLFADPARVDEIAFAFAGVIDAKSPYTSRHSARVMEASEVIARVLDLPAEDQSVIRRAALLHDIGKLSVPNTVLDKEGGLTPREWETVRLHPYYSERILGKISGFEEVALLAGAHHERLDGSGYFRNLKGDQIPPKARILPVADVYDALTGDRPYHPSLSHEEAVRALREEVQKNRLWGECVEAIAGCPLESAPAS